MDDGRFHDGSPQSFYFPEDHPTYPSHFKGMHEIIQERYERGAPLIPNPNPPNGKKLNGKCKNFQCLPGSKSCCLQQILYHQPDFAGQKSALEEVAKAQGYRVLFFPKFHCEINAIEQSWGFSKRIYCQFPASSIEDDLERNVIAALDAVPLKSQWK